MYGTEVLDFCTLPQPVASPISPRSPGPSHPIFWTYTEAAHQAVLFPQQRLDQLSEIIERLAGLSDDGKWVLGPQWMLFLGLMKVLTSVIFQGHVFYIVCFFPFTGSSLSCLLWRHLPLPCMPATHLLGWPLTRQPSRSSWPVSSGPEPVLCTVLYVICVPSSLTWDSSSMIVVSSWLLQDPQYFHSFVWDNVSCVPRWPVICLWSRGWPWTSAYPEYFALLVSRLFTSKRCSVEVAFVEVKWMWC